MSKILKNRYKNVIKVKTTNIATEAGHPRVYYKINPDVGYIVCNYSNTCFELADNADITSKEIFIYKGEI